MGGIVNEKKIVKFGNGIGDDCWIRSMGAGIKYWF